MTILSEYVEKNISVLREMQDRSLIIEQICKRILDSINNGGKVIILGNGGSASDSMHIASELVGRFEKERKPIPAIALTSDSSILTCISNDLDFEQVFSRQLLAIGNACDVVICLSTSGKSKNVLNAIEVAKGKGITTVAFTGNSARLDVDFCVSIPTCETSVIQNITMIIMHYICGIIEGKMLV